eukprot:Hpha_TRINITY_DN26767_c0_g1::TRINITY_DN26767_c0_g1_i1::g.138841::m.138841
MLWASGVQDAAPPSQQPAITEGVLSKFSIGKGPLTPRNWKSRWFVCEQEGLRYYAPNASGGGPRGEAKGEVPWKSVCHVYDTVDPAVHKEASDPGACYFGLRFHCGPKLRMLLLRSNSEHDRHGWLQGFSECMGLNLTSEMVQELEEEEELDRPLLYPARRGSGEGGGGA